MDKYIIGGVKELPPLQQGSLDSLCGLYSIINAIRITAYPQKQVKMHLATLLMHDGLDFLESKASLNILLQEGMVEALRVKLATHLIKRTHEHWGLRLHLSVDVRHSSSKDKKHTLTNCPIFRVTSIFGCCKHGPFTLISKILGTYIKQGKYAKFATRYFDCNLSGTAACTVTVFVCSIAQP